jgi:general secretion pathway protein D
MLFVLFIVGLSGASVVAQSNQEPARPKVIIQTPFGPKEIDADPAQPPPNAAPAAPAISPQPAAAPPPTGPAAAQPAPASQAPQSNEPANIRLVFDNQDIYGIIRIIADQLGLNYIIDPQVRGTVNISTSDTLRRSDLLPILETILKINGATMIKTGNFYQIVPANSAVRQPLEVEERSSATAPDDQMMLQILRMKYVAAREMSALLTPYVSEGGNIVVHEAGNVLLITERRSNMRKLLEIVDIFDTNAFEGERVRMFPVKNNLAKDIISDLEKIFAGYALSERSTAIRFVAIDRMNSILTVTPNASVFPEVEKWLQRLDQLVPSGIRNFVYKVRNAKASDIQGVLAQLYGNQVQLSSIYAPPAGAVPQSPGTNQPPAGGAAPNQSSPTVSVLQRPDIKIIADTVNNALVIQANPQIYAEIERTIQELDLLPRQVLIDAQIYEVVLDDSLSIGLSAFLQARDVAANRQTTGSFAAASGGVPSLTAQTFAFVGRSRELLGFLNASENRSRVRTLSAPSVLVSDNMTADFQVGAEVPIPTSSSVTPVQSGGTNLFAQTIQFRPTGVILRVKPQINDSGNVSLEISQEVSQAGANTTSGVVAPVIGKSAVNSSVVIQDGQTIALSGFIRENQELARSRVPLLGRIPVAGLLFGNTRRATTRTELIILITPHVLRSHEDTDLATDELKKKLREVQKVLK